MRPTRFQSAALTAGAILGSLCLLVALSGVLFGIKPLMFKSGSMEPTIPTGGLALSVPVDAAHIQVGDIVSTENSSGTRITHRVAAIAPADGYTQLTLKGDANDVVDAEVYAVTEVDRVFWSAPLLGYAVAWLSSPVALFLGGLLTAYLLYVAFGPGSRRDAPDGGDFDAPSATSGRRARRPGRRRGDSFRRVTGLTVAGTLVIAGGGLTGGRQAHAQFTDAAIMESTFKAGALPAPVIKCDNHTNGRGVKLSWTYSTYPVAPTYSVTWQKSGDSSWVVWNNMTAVSVKEFDVYASSFDSGVLALGGNTQLHFRVQAKSGNWLSPFGTRTTTYTAPVKVLISLTPSTLKCA